MTQFNPGGHVPRPAPDPGKPYVEIRHRGGWMWEVFLHAAPNAPVGPRWVGNRWGRERAERLGRQALHDWLNPPPGPEIITIRAEDL